MGGGHEEAATTVILITAVNNITGAALVSQSFVAATMAVVG